MAARLQLQDDPGQKKLESRALTWSGTYILKRALMKKLEIYSDGLEKLHIFS